MTYALRSVGLFAETGFGIFYFFNVCLVSHRWHQKIRRSCATWRRSPLCSAIEAMKETGGELTIRSGLNPEGQLFVSISDTGVGLPAGSSDRIFDAFHTTKAQGTGMGLAITRSILESHGGRIWATPNRGAGATFHFTLPVETEARA
jgi:hypothetical protein